jgi:hypothetical protein
MARRLAGLDIRYCGSRLRGEAKAILTLAGICAFVLAVAFYAVRQGKQPPQTIEATVLRFGASATDEGNKPLVIVRTADGRIRQLRAHRSRLSGCTAGAPIRLVRQGSLLRVHPAGCRPPR